MNENYNDEQENYDEGQQYYDESDRVNDRIVQIIEEKETLRGKKYFNELEDLVDSTLNQNLNLDVGQVFNYVRGMHVDKFHEQEREKETKRLITPEVTDWAKRKVEKGHYKNLTEALNAYKKTIGR